MISNSRALIDENNDDDDSTILNMLDDLNNDSFLDNSLLQATTQLDDSTVKEEILNEYNEMTQVFDKDISASDDEKEEEKKENENFLNDSSESSDSDDETVFNLNRTKVVNLNEIKTKVDTKSSSSLTLKTVKKINSTLLSSSSSSSSSDSDEDDHSNLIIAKHECKYFLNTDQNGNECSESATASSLRQHVCLNCDSKRDLTDSLEHMAFFSPPKSNFQQFTHDLTLGDSPTLVQQDLSLKYFSSESVTILPLLLLLQVTLNF
jgi:hypothetical protein